MLRTLTTHSIRASRSKPASSVAVFAVRNITSARTAVYDKHGAVDSVIKIVDRPLQEFTPNKVLLKILAAPMNPADFNMIEGVYSIRPPLPAIGGNEGVAEVIKAGENVKDLKVGDWVIPVKPGAGTWRTHAVADPKDLQRIANDIPAEDAATVSVNPCTAWRMLHDFKKLQKGDIVIQNGANSAVGTYVIQLCRQLGYRTINIIRNRPNFQDAIDRLKLIGADYVVSDEFLASNAMKRLMADEKLPAPSLGLNCVGGDTSLEIARLLADNSPMITYGGMSRKPVQVPTGRLIFNNISLHGFWMSRWNEEHSLEERGQMIKSLTDLIREKKLKSKVETWPFAQFHTALGRAREGYRDKKVVLTMDGPWS